MDGKWALVAVLLTSAAAAGGDPGMAVLASGDCRDAALLETAQLLRTTLRSRIGKQLASETLLEDRLGRPTPLSIEVVQRQFAAAQTHFYGAQFERALTELDQLRRDVHRLPMGQPRVEIALAIEAHRGLLLRSIGREREADESFQRMLRLDPTYQLDPIHYPTSTVKHFEELRSAFFRLPQEPLEITSTPAGARVYLDGREVGTTPYLGAVPRGSYRLELQKRDVWSLPRDIVVQGRTSLHVNLDFEGALQPGPCISSARSSRERLLRGTQAGAALGVDTVVLLRLEEREPSLRWLAIEMVRVATGELVREGGLKVGRNGKAAEDGVAELAQFVLTGRRSDRIVDLTASAEELGPERAESNEDPPKQEVAKSAPAPEVQRSLAPASSATPASPASTEVSWPRIGAVGLVSAGAVALGLGVVTHVQLFQSASRYDALRSKPEPTPADIQALMTERANFSALQTRMILAYGVGAAAAAAGGFLLYRTWPHAGEANGAQVAAWPIEGGGLVQVRAEF
ncbi:MAG: PEGA domain-containing protein [Myxococcaceae bacterium]|nr:PEGA domain-containing protein [Myxococcaceae bacterium]